VISGPIAISRALPPDVKTQLLGRPDSSELPCVRGRTFVPASCRDTLVVGYPNYLGVFDEARADRTILVTGRWSGLRQVPKDAEVIVIEEAATSAIAAEALADVRHLAKSLRQLKGVQLAIRPQSPIIIVLLPASLEPDARLLPGMTPLAGEFPEYPGGLRIEIPLDDTGFDISRYASCVKRLIAEEA
jgi:hypothetical protein